MNCRVVLSALLTAACLGASGASAQGLVYPVAYDRDRPVYWPGTAYYGTTTTASYATGYAPTPSPYEPAPSPYTPAPLPYTPAPAPYEPAPAYPAPAPSYMEPARAALVPVCRPQVPVCRTPCGVTRNVVTSYVPAYTPNYVTYSPRVVTSYSVPAYQTPVVTAAAGPRVIVRPKVYVQGQPLRNLLRAITP